MQKIGIIGGAGPLASALLYETFIQESYRQQLIIPEIFLINYPFSRGLTYQEKAKNEKKLQEELKYCIQQLEKHQVEIGMIACNTLHLYMQKSAQTSILLLGLPQLVLEEAIQQQHCRLLLLGTQNTCSSSLYLSKEIDLIFPSKTDQMLIDSIIDRILEGKINKQDAQSISQLIEKVSEQLEFDGVILGCTDLPVLHHTYPIQSSKPLYDSIKIPAKKLRGLI